MSKLELMMSAYLDFVVRKFIEERKKIKLFVSICVIYFQYLCLMIYREKKERRSIINLSLAKTISKEKWISAR